MDLRDDSLLRQGLRRRAGIPVAAFKAVSDEDDHFAAGEVFPEVLRRLLEGVGDGGLPLGLDLPDEGLHLLSVQGTDGDLQLCVLAVVRPVSVDPQAHGDPFPLRQVVDDFAQGVLRDLDPGGAAEFCPHAPGSVQDELDVSCGLILGQDGAPGTSRQEEEKKEQRSAEKSGTIHHYQPPRKDWVFSM